MEGNGASLKPQSSVGVTASDGIAHFSVLFVTTSTSWPPVAFHLSYQGGRVSLPRVQASSSAGPTLVCWRLQDLVLSSRFVHGLWLTAQLVTPPTTRLVGPMVCPRLDQMFTMDTNTTYLHYHMRVCRDFCFLLPTPSQPQLRSDAVRVNDAGPPAPGTMTMTHSRKVNQRQSAAVSEGVISPQKRNW